MWSFILFIRKVLKYCLSSFPYNLPRRAGQEKGPEAADNRFPDILLSAAPGPGQRSIETAVPDPRNCSRYHFLDFIEQTPQKYIPQILTQYNEQGYKLCPEFAAAAYRKLQYGIYTNPLDFEKEFENKFDFIVFDSESTQNYSIILYVRHSRMVFKYCLPYKTAAQRSGTASKKEKAYTEALNHNTVITWNTNEQAMNAVLRTCRQAPVSPERVVVLCDTLKSLGLATDKKRLGEKLNAGNFFPAHASLFYARVWMALQEKISDSAY